MRSHGSSVLTSFNKWARRISGKKACATFVLSLVSAGVSAQQQNPEPDRDTVQVLLKKVEQLEAKDAQLEARILQLEADRHTTSTASPPVVSPPALPAAITPSAAVPTEVAQAGPVPVPGTQPDETQLRIRGFGDFNFHGDTKKGDTNSFSLGELDLFITSDISDKFKFLSELVFEVHQNNEFEEDLERVLLKYSYNDHLNLSFGRYHTAIGYYNTAYHHSTWFQTTTERPFLFQYEDEGGILPVHSVGVSATGQIPSGRLGLNYVAEIGNGRTSRSPLLEPVQNAIDENNHKDFNLAVFAKPEAIPGLQVGFSAYRDLLMPAGQPKIGETILDAYGVLIRSDFEWLNEALLIRHGEQGIPHAFETAGFYSQISKRFGSYRPYFRYQYANAPSNEPVFSDVGLRQGPSVGLRYDATESVALKLQYDYTALRRQAAIQSLGLQLAFAF